MRVLVICLGNSQHMVDNVRILGRLGWDVHVVTAIDAPWADGFSNCTIHHTTTRPPPAASTGLRVVDYRTRIDACDEPAAIIADLIDTVRPDIVHSHETQQAAALALRVRRRRNGKFPLWVTSTWGSDLYHYCRTARDRALIGEVLRSADVLWTDCWRDAALARSEGFRGTCLPVTPVGGGYDIAAAMAQRCPGPTSRRRGIAVKGFNTWVGRGMNALDALDLCGDLLRERTISLHQADSTTECRAEEICARYGARLRVLSGVTKETILTMHGNSRVSLALNMSDGTSKGFLEALVGGSFPIQSYTSAASEWIVHAESGFLVDPTDVRAVASMLRVALVDDRLVDGARTINDAAVRAHLDAAAIEGTIVAGYHRVAELARSHALDGECASAC